MVHLIVDLVVATLLVSFVATARKSYQSLIPNGKNVPNWPAVGHSMPKAEDERRNPFGVDFNDESKKWTKALCEKDSDGDGKRNGEELGDPDCTWEVGAIPKFSVGLTNPGIFDNFTLKDNGTVAQNSSNDHDDHGLPAQPWKIVHAIFMSLSFGLLIPVSAAFPFYMRAQRTEGKWRDDHIKLMYVGFTIGIVGFMVAVASMGIEITPHGIIGLILMIVVIVQGILGYYRQSVPTWVKWRKSHSLVGRGIVLVIALQVFLGYVELNENAPIVAIIVGLVHTGIIVVIFAAIMRAYWKRHSDTGFVADGMGEGSVADFSPLEAAQSARDYQLT